MRLFLCAAVLSVVPLLSLGQEPKKPVEPAKPDAAKLEAAKPAVIDEAAKKVVEAAIKAHGGKEALDKYAVSTAKIKGEMRVYEVDTPFTGEMTAVRPDKVRLELSSEVLNQKTAIVQIVNGDKVKQTRNGQVNKLGDAEVAEIKQLGYIQEATSLTPLVGGKYGLKAEKDEKVGEADAAVVLVTTKGMKDLRLFFDKKTNLLIKTSRKSILVGSIEPKELIEEQVLSEFKEINKVKMATKTVVTQDGKKFMTLEVLEAKFLEKADPKLFEVAD